MGACWEILAWMLNYPGWVSKLDRTRMDQAMEQAAAPLVCDSSPHVVVMVPRYPSAAAAVQAVLAVLEVGARVLHRRRDQQTVETLHVTAETWRDELIAWVAQSKPSGFTLDEIETMVDHALDTCQWWTPFRSPASPVPTPLEPHRATPDKRLHLTLKEAAKALRRHISTIRRMTKQGELQSVKIRHRVFIPTAEIDKVRATPKL